MGEIDLRRLLHVFFKELDFHADRRYEVFRRGVACSRLEQALFQWSCFRELSKQLEMGSASFLSFAYCRVRTAESREQVLMLSNNRYGRCLS